MNRFKALLGKTDKKGSLNGCLCRPGSHLTSYSSGIILLLKPVVNVMSEYFNETKFPARSTYPTGVIYCSGLSI